MWQGGDMTTKVCELAIQRVSEGGHGPKSKVQSPKSIRLHPAFDFAGGFHRRIASVFAGASTRQDGEAIRRGKSEVLNYYELL
jgi:hypothetical protein